jgi:hypothetical protein
VDVGLVFDLWVFGLYHLKWAMHVNFVVDGARTWHIPKKKTRANFLLWKEA